MTHFIINAILLDVAWALAVIPAAQGLTWIGPIFSLCWLGFHIVYYPTTRLADIKLCISAALLGYAIDSMLVVNGMISFPEHAQTGSPSTIWMIALWINLALTLNHSLVWLQHRYLLAAMIGAIAGPIAYFAGDKLNAMTLDAGNLSLLAICIVWLATMPLLVWLTYTIKRFEKNTHYTGAAL